MFLKITPDEKASPWVNISLPALVQDCNHPSLGLSYTWLYAPRGQGWSSLYLRCLIQHPHHWVNTRSGLIIRQRWSPELSPLSYQAGCRGSGLPWGTDKAVLILVKLEPRIWQSIIAFARATRWKTKSECVTENSSCFGKICIQFFSKDQT